jgi:hypothetical protein
VSFGAHTKGRLTGLFGGAGNLKVVVIRIERITSADSEMLPCIAMRANVRNRHVPFSTRVKVAL